MMKKILVAVILAAGLMMFSSTTWAAAGADVTYWETQTSTGWRYDYSIKNTSTTNWEVYGLLLFFSDSTGADYETSLTDMTTANGWYGQFGNESISGERTTYVATFAEDPIAGGADFWIDRGVAQTGFGFNVDYRAGNLDYIATFVQGDSTDNLSGKTSLSSEPVPVAPEPLSAVLLLVGVATLGVRGYLRKE